MRHANTSRTYCYQGLHFAGLRATFQATIVAHWLEHIDDDIRVTPMARFLIWLQLTYFSL